MSPEKKEIFIDGIFYDISNWEKIHPGGKVINYYTEIGEDASIPFQQFHNRSIKKVLAVREILSKRLPTENELQQFSRNQRLNEGFKKLHDEFTAEELFNPSLSHVALRLGEFFLYFITALFILNCGIDEAEWTWMVIQRSLGVFILTMAYGRIVWLAHEGGHYSLTGWTQLDHLLQSFLYGFGNGLSASWWNHNHSKHHAMPQRIKRDVDLDTLPLLAFTSKITNLPLTNVFIKYQSISFLPLQTFLVVLRWSFDLHPKYCWYKKNYLELLFIFLHFLTIPMIGIVNFIIAKWLWGIYMFGNFSLSHTHLPVVENDGVNSVKHWIQYGFEHTVNIHQSLWMNWWMGYLNLQIEHHLFPTMPQFRIPKIQSRVENFAKEFGLPYRQLGYIEAVGMTLGNLHKVSNELINRNYDQKSE